MLIPCDDEFLLVSTQCRNQQLAEQLATIVRQKQDLLVQVDKLAQQVNELHGRLEAVSLIGCWASRGCVTSCITYFCSQEKQQMAAQNLQEQNVFRQQIQVCRFAEQMCIFVFF